MFYINFSFSYLSVTDPNNEATITQSPSPFIIDGKSMVVLTCLAASSVPGVSLYDWTVETLLRILCESTDLLNNTCSYTPRAEHAEKTVRCKVYNPRTKISVEGYLRPQYFCKLLLALTSLDLKTLIKHL